MTAPVSAPAKKTKSSKPKAPANHPSVIDMVKAAILAAKDRKGSSLPTIKKCIAANYKFDVEKQAAHIRRGIVHAVGKGVLVRVGNKGKGASGSFKVAEKKSAESKPKAKPAKAKVHKPKKAANPKKPKVKKAAKPKVKAAHKPKAHKKPKKAATPKKHKTPKKTAAKKATPKKK